MSGFVQLKIAESKWDQKARLIKCTKGCAHFYGKNKVDIYINSALQNYSYTIFSRFVMLLLYANAGYTPQDNRTDVGPISPLPAILGNVPIILVDLKIILSDFSVVWGVLRVTESALNNVGGIVNIQHVENVWSEILLCGVNTEDKRAFDLQIITWNKTISNQKESWQGTEA